MIFGSMTSLTNFISHEIEDKTDESIALPNGSVDAVLPKKHSNGYLVSEKPASKLPADDVEKSSVPDDTIIPFPLLPGENVVQRMFCTEASVILTNYRLFASLPDTFHNIPVRTIEYVEMRELTVVHVYCKYGKVVRLCLDSPADCADLWRHITSLEAAHLKSEDFFAFKYLSTLKCNDLGGTFSAERSECEAALYVKDIKRMGFNTTKIWRTTEINSKFEVCKTYPKFHIVPSSITDDDIKEVAQFRSMRRFPSVVWRSKINGCVIARCSQPEVGWFGWRCEKDEQLLNAIAQAAQESKLDCVDSLSAQEMKAQSFLLVDARSYATAVANRAKGGGCECQEYYPTCDIQFMGLVNIHAIRKSFQSVRTLSVYGPDQSNWYSSLEKTGWLHYLSALLRSSLVIVNAIHEEKRSAIVHCSDGWDRTTQLVSLAELLLDPFYRTIQGFCILIEREWLEFGHKFADRCGHSADKNINESSPVFYQWLDAVYQIMKQFPSAFEFNESFLLKLVHHTYTCLFGTFLCNSIRERHQLKVKINTACIWNFLMSGRKDFVNYLYVPSDEVLYPSSHLRNMQFWENVFISDKQCSFPQSRSESTKSADLTDSGNFTHNSASSNGGLKICQTKISDESSTLLTSYAEELANAVTLIDNAANHEGTIAGHSTDNDIEINHEKNSSIELNANMNNLVMNEAGKALASHCNNISNLSTSSDPHSLIELKEFKDYRQQSLPCVETEPTDDDANSTLSDNSNEKSKMTDSIKTLTGELCRTPSFDDTCLPRKVFQEPEVDPGQILMDHRTQGMRKAYSTPDSLRAQRLIRTKSVPDIVSASLFPDGDISNKYPSLERNKVIVNKNLNRDLSKYIDCDGLTKFQDLVDFKLQHLEERHCHEVAKLQKRVYLERQARLELQKQLQRLSAKDSVEYSPVTFSDASHEDLLSYTGSTSGGRSSVSSLSNEEGWEQVQYDDVTPTRWVPDHISSNCSSCGQQFSVMLRRHHCRKCGAVFCDSCSSHQIAVPDEHFYDPVRVCKTCYESIAAHKTI